MCFRLGLTLMLFTVMAASFIAPTLAQLEQRVPEKDRAPMKKLMDEQCGTEQKKTAWEEGRKRFEEQRRAAELAGEPHPLWEVLSGSIEPKEGGTEIYQNIRVNKSELRTIWETSFWVAKELVMSKKPKAVRIAAVGGWHDNYLGMDGPITTVAYGRERIAPQYGEDWLIRIPERVPTPAELEVIRAWRNSAPANFYLESCGFSIDSLEFNEKIRDEMMNGAGNKIGISRQAAENIFLSFIRIGEKDISLAFLPGCQRWDPRLMCVDFNSISKPDKFPDPVRAVNAACPEWRDCRFDYTGGLAFR